MSSDSACTAQTTFRYIFHVTGMMPVALVRYGNQNLDPSIFEPFMGIDEENVKLNRRTSSFGNLDAVGDPKEEVIYLLLIQLP